jgi:hypothetical protein
MLDRLLCLFGRHDWSAWRYLRPEREWRRCCRCGEWQEREL